MKITPVFFRIFKLALASAAVLLLASCSAGTDEGSVTLSVPRSAYERIASRAAGEGDALTFFITGGYEAKKTVYVDDGALSSGGSVTVRFDGVRAGAKVRVVCASEPFGSLYKTECFIGVSDEIVVASGEENAASIRLSMVFMSVDDSDTSMSVSSGLSGCQYRWYFKSNDEALDQKEVSLTTSSPSCSFASYVGANSGFNNVGSIQKCTIYCGGTEIVTLENGTY